MGNTNSNATASGVFAIETYHVPTNLGDEDIEEQFFNPVFCMVTILCIIFLIFMLLLCLLLTTTFLRPHCSRFNKYSQSLVTLIFEHLSINLTMNNKHLNLTIIIILIII